MVDDRNYKNLCLRFGKKYNNNNKNSITSAFKNLPYSTLMNIKKICAKPILRKLNSGDGTQLKVRYLYKGNEIQLAKES